MKHIFDFTIAALGVIALFPLLAVIAIAINLDSRGPILYRTRRAGLRRKPFTMLKFRTMLPDAEKLGGPSTPFDDPRITRIGRRLRKYKLDELPQLFNVLCGQMSLVGPRPEVLSEVATYSPDELQLFSVVPGMTDWASLRFSDEGEILRGAADPHAAYLQRIRPEKIRLGLRYVRERSFLIDLKIIAHTLRAVIPVSIPLRNPRGSA